VSVIDLPHVLGVPGDGPDGTTGRARASATTTNSSMPYPLPPKSPPMKPAWMSTVSFDSPYVATSCFRRPNGFLFVVTTWTTPASSTQAVVAWGSM
jgi:hypothetical protein